MKWPTCPFGQSHAVEATRENRRLVFPVAWHVRSLLAEINDPPAANPQ